MSFNARLQYSLMAFLLLSQAAFTAPIDFETAGPYPVGVTTTVMIDHTRNDALPSGPRTLLTEIWYPSTEVAQSFPLNKFSDFMLKGSNPGINMAIKMAFKIDLAAIDASFDNKAFRDAPVAEGNFPLIIFSHGNGGFRMQNVYWCEHLASHGYIVVAADHTGNAAATVVNGQVVLYNGDRLQAAKDRPLDVSFLISQMELWNKGADSRFVKKIDLEKIGVGGHSFGGYTSTWVAETDDRVDAIVPMAGVAPNLTQINDTPLLILMATEDDTIGAEGNAVIRDYYATSTGPKYFVEFVDAGHYSFSEMFQFSPNFGDGIGTGKRIGNGEAITFTSQETMYRYTNGYSLAFLNTFVKGIEDEDAAQYLSSNHDSKVMIHKSAAPAKE